YLYADADGPFEVLAYKDFGAADVIAIRGLCTTGWQADTKVEVRLIHLDVRAEQMPNKGSPPTPDAKEEAGVVVPEGTPRIWMIIGGLGIGLPIIALAVGVGLWLVAGKRRSVRAKPPSPKARKLADSTETAAPPSVVLCQSCRKKIRVKPELAGK